MENVLRRNEIVVGLKDLFVGANVAGGNFVEWFKGFNNSKESEKAETVGKLVDSARSNVEIFNSCNAVYNEKEINVIINEIPKVSEGKTFTHADTIKNIQYLDFIATILSCVTEEVDVRYINFQAYLDFNEDCDDEDEYWGKHCKYAFNEEDKYSILETVAGMSFDDMEDHFISFYEEDINGSRFFLKLDNGIEIVVDKMD